MLVRLPISDTQLSEPFLVTVGPMATPFQGYPVQSTQILKLAESAPRPVIHADTPIPAELHPTPPPSRPLRPHVTGFSRLKMRTCLRLTHRELFMVLTSELLHQTIVTYDTGDFIHSQILEQPDIREWNLAVTKTTSDGSTSGSNTILAWTTTDTVPPDPHSTPTWNPSLGDTTATHATCDPYQPKVRPSLAHLQPETSPVTDSASFICSRLSSAFPLAPLSIRD
jgi:hypothetical protein